MITLGVKKVDLGPSWRNFSAEQVAGYYLVLPNFDRHFISTKVDALKLEKVCNKYLSDKEYNYWIDYCYGYDINGILAWMNLDCTDSFL